MANPITWRNIAAPNFSGASDMMGKAQESFTGALDALGDTKDQFEQGRTKRNTQDFMAELSKYRTPEELAAAQESGAIDALRQQYSGNGLIDTDKTDAGAIRDTLTGLRQTRVADREYADSETEFANREARDNAQAALASGNLERFDEILANNDFVNQKELAQGRADAAERIRQRGIADEQRAFTQRKQGRLEDQWGRDDAFRESIAAARTAGADRRLRDNQASEGLVAAATEMGLPVVDGAVDFSNATQEQQAQLRSMVQEQDLLDRTSDTQYVNQTMAKLLESNPDMSPERELSLREMLVNETSQGSSLTPTDQAKIVSAQEALKESSNIAQNPFNTPRESSDVEAADILAQDPRFLDWNAGEREKATRQVTQAMSDGVKVGNKTFPVTPAIAQMALQISGNAWTEVDGTFNDAVKKLVADNSLADKLEEYETWKKADKELVAAGKAEFGSGRKASARQSRFRNFLDSDLSTPAQSRLDLPKPSNQNNTRPQRGGL